MQNLVSVSDEIKAVVASCTGTPTAKLIALLEAAGITKAADVAEAIGISDRAVRKAKAELRDRNHSSSGTTVPELQDRVELQDRNSGSESGTTVPDSASRVLDNNKLTSLEDSSKKNNNPLPPTKTKRAKPEFGKAEALEAFHAYNATALECGLPQSRKLTGQLESRIIARLKDYGLDGWRQALENIGKSKFLCEPKAEGEWRPSLSWMVQESSFAKLIDGAYGNGRHVAGKAAQSQIKYSAPDWYYEEKASMGGVA